MRWHDAREVIPEEGEHVLVLGIIAILIIARDEMGTGWSDEADGGYWSTEEHPYWISIHEIFEELEEND